MAEEAKDPASALTRLTEASHALTYAASLDDVLDITVECAMDLLGARRAVLMLEDDDALLRIRAARGVPETLVGKFGEPLDETLVARLESLLGPESWGGFLGVPLVVRGAVIGLLAVLREDAASTMERDEWLLSALADQAAVALASASGDDVVADLEAEVRELRRATLRREDALRMITHDLRSPLSALHGYLHLLDTDMYGPLTEAQRSAVQRLQTVSRHLEGLVADVVEVSQLASGTLVLECEPVDVADVAADAVAMVELAAKDHGVRVVVDVPAGLRARAEPDRLRQVLVHLLENAVRYAPEGTEVSIMARAGATGAGAEGEPRETGETSAEASAEGGPVTAKECVVIRVVDRGPGIPASEREAIFQPYHRLAPGTRGSGGLGLGLAIGRALVDLMDGTLAVDPEVERGAAFELRLPCP